MSEAPIVQPPKAITSASRGNAETVTVACKLPNGVILQNCVMEDRREPMMGGGFKEVKRARRLPETYKVNGSAFNTELLRSGDVPYTVVAGFGITPGIPKEFWERWLDANRDTDLVKGGFIFAHVSESDARRYASEHVGLKSGLEPIDPDAPGAFAGNQTRGIQVGTRT